MKFWQSRKRVEALRQEMDRAENDIDRHRIHAHGLIDAWLEDGDITPEQAIQKKKDWDNRHRY